ncbi:helix-turn-helix domain-containing protein [Chelativorans sp. Marseille-P2723]|uniref:helix-turn-helix domain-containing protein n=1 Tax=Chelativorans sp. Marseille-P2723 TaxID=2709133 RepID=UPI0015710EF0|nr:helix-turn-helix domain-containing protein [Chelativorans sp. Marseille-P2723]
MYNSSETYRVGFNPDFLARVRKKKRAEAKKAAKEEMRRQIEARAKQYAERAKQMEKSLDTLKAQRAAEIRFSKMMAEISSRSEKRRSAPIRVIDIIAIVAAKHGLTIGDIKGPLRQRNIVLARHEAIALARKERPDLSLTQLGRQFDRDHTSILHALRRMGMPTASRQE